MFSTSSIRNHCSGAKFQDRTKSCHQVLPSVIKKTNTRFLYHYVPNLAGSPHLGISIAEANVGSYNDIQVKWNNRWKQVLTREKTLVVNNLIFIKQRNRQTLFQLIMLFHLQTIVSDFTSFHIYWDFVSFYSKKYLLERELQSRMQCRLVMKTCSHFCFSVQF